MKQVIPQPFYVYDFPELSNKAKSKAFDIIKDKIIDDGFYWFEDETKGYLFESYGLKVKLHADLSYSQGDGVSFDCDDFNTAQIVDNIMKDDSIAQTVKDNIKHLGDNLRVKTKNDNPGHYTYSHESHVTAYLNDEKADIMPGYIMEAIEEAYAKQYVGICEYLEGVGKNIYNVTEKAVKDYCDSYGIEFLENGSVYNE